MTRKKIVLKGKPYIWNQPPIRHRSPPVRRNRAPQSLSLQRRPNKPAGRRFTPLSPVRPIHGFSSAGCCLSAAFRGTVRHISCRPPPDTHNRRIPPSQAASPRNRVYSPSRSDVSHPMSFPAAMIAQRSMTIPPDIKISSPQSMRERWKKCAGLAGGQVISIRSFSDRVFFRPCGQADSPR